MKGASNLTRPYRILPEEVYYHIHPGLVFRFLHHADTADNSEHQNNLRFCS